MLTFSTKPDVAEFSAGGTNNLDLPPESTYRTVNPMAVTIDIDNGQVRITPWRIDYQRFTILSETGFCLAP